MQNPICLLSYLRNYCLTSLVCLLLWLPGPSLADETIKIAAPENIDSRALTVFKELYEEAYSAIGYEIQIETYPTQRAWAAVTKGHFDAYIGGVSNIGDQIENVIRVPTPFLRLELTVCSNKGFFSAEPPVSWESIQPYSIAYTQGLKIFDARLGNREKVAVPSPDLLLPMLQKGRVDLIAGPQNNIDSHIQALGLEPDFFDMDLLETVEIYHYLNVEHSGLATELSKVFDEMQARGILARRQDEIFASILQARTSH